MNSIRHLVALAAFLAAASAHACLFARDAQPKDWMEWATVLLAADVADVKLDAAKAMDVISLRVVETFKGPPAAQNATLQVPSRMWSACRLERPAVGARMLVAINPNSDALLVPLSAEYTERLRAAKPQ